MRMVDRQEFGSVLAHGPAGPAVALVEPAGVRAAERRGIAGNTVYELTLDKTRPAGVAAR